MSRKQSVIGLLVRRFQDWLYLTAPQTHLLFLDQGSNSWNLLQSQALILQEHYTSEREELQERKAYICFFTCTTAVHLEVVSDLSVQTFLHAYRRFAARKSTPQQMISDNASTYLSAAEELFQSATLKESLGR